MLFWTVFHVCIVAGLILDLRGSERDPLPRAILWIFGALLFNGGILLVSGADAALTFLTAYSVELFLSVDNLFVFAAIFAAFGIERRHRSPVLLWGVVGAFAFRVVCILGGIHLIESFDSVYFLFGAFLCVSAVFMQTSKKSDFRSSFFLKRAGKMFRLEPGDHQGKFFLKKRNKIFATRLFVGLFVLEGADLLFAVDSIPAVLGITTDPFLAYTSNVFAVLGLRSFYLLLEKQREKTVFLQKAVPGILFLIGVKMLISPFFTVSRFACLFGVAAVSALFFILERKKGKTM